MLPMAVAVAVAWPCGGIVVHYALLVLWMRS